MCQDNETANPIGKACYRYCVKYRILHRQNGENCKEWKTEVMDLTKESDFKSFRDAGFVLINSDRVF